MRGASIARASAGALALAGALASGCASRQGVPSAAEPPTTARRPDGVAIDLPSAPVAASASADVQRAQEAALVPPLSPALATRVLRAYVDAASREDAPALEALLAPTAKWSNPAMNPNNATSLSAVWHERFRRLNYGALAGAPLVRDADAEVYTYNDLHARLRGRPAPPAAMTTRDVLVRARVLTPRVGPERLFGDEIALLLRPSVGRYVIHEVYEDFAVLP